jgi:hypothetical protein
MAVTCTDHRKAAEGYCKRLYQHLRRATEQNKQHPQNSTSTGLSDTQTRLLNLGDRNCKFSPNVSTQTRTTAQTVGRQIACADAWAPRQCSPCGTHGGCIWPGFGCISLRFPCDIIPGGGGRTAAHCGPDDGEGFAVSIQSELSGG